MDTQSALEYILGTLYSVQLSTRGGYMVRYTMRAMVQHQPLHIPIGRSMIPRRKYSIPQYMHEQHSLLVPLHSDHHEPSQSGLLIVHPPRLHTYPVPIIPHQASLMTLADILIHTYIITYIGTVPTVNTVCTVHKMRLIGQSITRREPMTSILPTMYHHHIPNPTSFQGDLIHTYSVHTQVNGRQKCARDCMISSGMVGMSCMQCKTGSADGMDEGPQPSMHPSSTPTVVHIFVN